MRNVFRTAALLSTLLVAVRLPAPAQDARTETRQGLHTATFETPRGGVKVHLPDDMAAGDVISGTVVAEPRGDSERERSAAMDVLSGYVIVVEPAQTPTERDTLPPAHRLPLSPGPMPPPRTPVSARVLRWSVPAALAGAAASIVLRDGAGREVGRTRVPVQPPDSQRVPTPASGSYTLPRIGQQGRPLEIPGPFDGSFDNTSVRIGERPAALLAESPRKLVVESPRDSVGPMEIALREGGVETRGTYRNVGVRLTAPKTDLRRGEGTTLTIQVQGLQGLDSAQTLELENRTPGVVSMEGGDAQRLTIEPAQVDSAGVFTATRAITGQQPGSFSVAATLVLSGLLAGMLPHIWNVSKTPHAAGVTHPPTHWRGVTWPTHAAGITWPTHNPGVTWVAHTVDVTYGPPGVAHMAGQTWPHVAGITRWEHYEEISYDGAHVAGVTWPGSHAEDITFPAHQARATFPPHRTTGSWAPAHTGGRSWPPIHVDPTTWPSHSVSFTWPTTHQAATTQWRGPYREESVPLPRRP